MNFSEKLTNYAELIVAHGLNVQKGQVVNIITEAIHRDFVMLVAECAYRRGASYVNTDFSDSRLARLRIASSGEENLKFVPAYVSAKFRELVDCTAANLKLIGPEEPDILADLDPKKINTVRFHQYKAMEYFYEEGIGKSRLHWTVAAAATPKWAHKVFPEIENSTRACKKLWDEIFRMCRADKRDCLERWKKHNTVLHERGQKLTSLRIKEIRFTGPGTDLTVVLSPQAVFRGGSDLSPRAVQFEPNLPTEEVFTTPDSRGTQGYVQTTRPFFINGKLIKGLRLKFCSGEIVEYQADEGLDTFREYISSDVGAKYLGEVALVGIDSPVYQSGLVFQEILFDENAACHIAVGSAYKFCLAGGESMNKEELKRIGCNESSVHTDMMISSDEVDVKAFCYDGREVMLLEKGRWVL